LSVKVDHNYPNPGDMLAEDEDGNKLQYVSIKIFALADFEAGDTDSWESETETDVNGKWIDPVYLAEGEDWVIEFSRPTTHDTVYVNISTVVP